MKISDNINVIVIEGVIGSGKSKLTEEIVKNNPKRKIFHYTEEELLFSWKHAWIKNIDKLRLDFMNDFLNYMSSKIKEDKKSLFVLDRFHISLFLLPLISRKIDLSKKKKFIKLVTEIEKLNVLTIIVTIKDFKNRFHLYRGQFWKEHLSKRLKNSGFNTLEEMSNFEQKKIIELVNKLKINYKIKPN